MKNNFIIKNIRSALAKQLIFPVLLLLFSLAVLYRTPKDNFFSPRPLNCKSNYENFYNRDLPHVTVTVPHLTYSGLDYVVDGHVRGHYYYAVNDGFCQFYVLAKSAGVPAGELDSAHLKGRLIRLNDIEYGSILKQMAEILGWTSASIRKMSSAYAVSTVPYPVYLNLAFFVVLYGCILIPAFDILYSVLYICKPLRAPTFRRLAAYGEIRTILPRAELEMKHAGAAEAGGIYLTPGYLINIDAVRTAILPLTSVAWIYYRRPPGPFSGKRRCTLRVLTRDGRTHRFTKKKKADLDYILDMCRLRNPELLAGYSKENRAKAARACQRH